MGEKQQGTGHPRRFITPSTVEKISNGVRLKVLDYESKCPGLNQVPVHLQATVGQMVHHGFASWQPDDLSLERSTRLQELIKRMQLSGYLGAPEMDQSFEAFWNYIITRYQVLRVYKELPVLEVAAKSGTVTSGIADLVLETDNGLVLIDHKTFPGHFDLLLDEDHDQFAGKHASQLQTYKQLLEKATGKPVTATLLHYVMQGRIVEVRVNQGVKTKRRESQAALVQLTLW